MKPDIGSESRLHSIPPLGGFPSEYRYGVWYEKTRMLRLPDDKNILKICLFVSTECTNVTDGLLSRFCVVKFHVLQLRRQKLHKSAVCDCGQHRGMNDTLDRCPLTKFECGLKLRGGGKRSQLAGNSTHSLTHSLLRLTS